MTRLVIAVALAIGALSDGALAESPLPTYQRSGRHSEHYRHPVAKRRHAPRPDPTIGAGTFQRPYPYHLDYYKHRWGGSYEPYFGNLYGVPNVVGSPFYGGFGYGGYGLGGYPGPFSPQTVCPHCHQPYFPTGEGAVSPVPPVTPPLP